MSCDKNRNRITDLEMTSANGALIESSGIDELKKAGVCTLSMAKKLSAGTREVKGMNGIPTADQCAGVPRVTHAEPKHLIFLPASRFVLLVWLLEKRKPPSSVQHLPHDERDGKTSTDEQQQHAKLFTSTENEKPATGVREVDHTIRTPLPPSFDVNLICELQSAVRLDK